MASAPFSKDYVIQACTQRIEKLRPACQPTHPHHEDAREKVNKLKALKAMAEAATGDLQLTSADFALF